MKSILSGRRLLLQLNLEQEIILMEKAKNITKFVQNHRPFVELGLARQVVRLLNSSF